MNRHIHVQTCSEYPNDVGEPTGVLRNKNRKKKRRKREVASGFLFAFAFLLLPININASFEWRWVFRKSVMRYNATTIF